MKYLTLLLSFVFLSSCFEAATTSRTFKSTSSVSTGDGEGGSGNNITDDGSGGVATDDEVTAKVEIRHLIEPSIDSDSVDTAGEYKQKMTIPKNYNGYLYVAGINVSTLSAESIKVRFNFGLNSTPITVQARVGTAPGLTPQTDVQVLIMDLSSKPFEDVQLLYELYDYNTYDFAGTGSDVTALDTPVTFNRNDKLFCRGLSLANDPTFTGSLSNKCSSSDDVCKYTYAKVIDKGLVEHRAPASENIMVPIVPTERNVQSGDVGYYDDDESLILQRCLPDNPMLSSRYYFNDSHLNFDDFLTSDVIGTTTYYYNGPYRAINTENWHISDDAIFGIYGLFASYGDVNGNGTLDGDEIQYGYKSRLFPLYYTTTLPSGVEYMGSSVPDEEKVLTTTSSSTTSLWMDGCNARASIKNTYTGEHIGSCNVTASMEIIKVTDDGDEIVVDSTDEVKLQLVKETNINSSGDDVLLSSFQQCSSSNQCGSDSCCINKRCWSKTLVSQCVEDLPSFGNLVTGDSCESDYECSSLCCNKTSGRCAPHDTTSTNPSYCSKDAGQTCVAKDWCAKYPITTCDIVSGADDINGNATCELRCITTEVYGDCVSSDGVSVGTCTSPCTPSVPDFNEADENRCDNAITLAELQEKAASPEDYCE